MLDFFLHKGWLIMDKEFNLHKTPTFPKDVTFQIDENGIVKFYYDYKTCLIPINTDEYYESHTSN